MNPENLLLRVDSSPSGFVVIVPEVQHYKDNGIDGNMERRSAPFVLSNDGGRQFIGLAESDPLMGTGYFRKKLPHC